MKCFLQPGLRATVNRQANANQFNLIKPKSGPLKSNMVTQSASLNRAPLKPANDMLTDALKSSLCGDVDGLAFKWWSNCCLGRPNERLFSESV